MPRNRRAREAAPAGAPVAWRSGQRRGGRRSPATRWRRPKRGSFDLLTAFAVAVKPAPGFLAEPPRGHQVPEKGGGAVLVVAEVAVQDPGDEEHGVEADQIGELERAHRMREAELGALVDVLFR